MILLLSASLLSLMPSATLADQQTQPEQTTINLSGQAIPFDSGNGTGIPASATLNLAGEIQKIGGSEFTIQNLTGSLQIGSTSYMVYDGQGDANQDGVIWITATTNSNVDDHQLVLNGNIQGNALTFPAPSSRLTNQFFLALNGNIAMSDQQGSNMINAVSNNLNESNASYTPLANATLTQNSTIVENFFTSSLTNAETINATQILNNSTVLQFTNQTVSSIENTLPQNPIGTSANVTTIAIQMPNNNASITQYSNVSLSVQNTLNSTGVQNVTTYPTTNATTVAIQMPNNVTISGFSNQSATNPSPAPQIVTVTVTQPQFNQTITIYVTATVANSTITETVTNTEANVTITQSYATTTPVANATIIVTNSTATIT
jgi:hypothetical protein